MTIWHSSTPPPVYLHLSVEELKLELSKYVAKNWTDEEILHIMRTGLGFPNDVDIEIIRTRPAELEGREKVEIKLDFNWKPRNFEFVIPKSCPTPAVSQELRPTGTDN